MKTYLRALAGIVLLAAFALAGANAVSAQSREDFMKFQRSGTGQCVTDEGYGRYGSCDAAGQ